jgi:RNA polymerase sigma-70 factor (ECF subfamily)
VTDEALLAAVARGEDEALALLHQRYARMVFATALRVVADWQEAEDVTQDLFVQVWLRARLFDPGRGRCGGWLRRMAHNLAVNGARRRWAAGPVARLTDELDAGDRQLADPRVDIEEEVWSEAHRRATATALATALPALPPAQRAVLVAAYYGGLSQVEIAARTGLPLGTVKSRARIGLRRLRGLVGPSVTVTPAGVEAAS